MGRTVTLNGRHHDLAYKPGLQVGTKQDKPLIEINGRKLFDVNINGYDYPPADPNCVLYLPGLPGYGSTVWDRSGNGNHGTIYGASWKRTSGGAWYLSHDGINDRVSIADSASLDTITSTMTIIWWLKPKSPDGWFRYLTKDLAAAAGTTFYFLDWGGTGIRFGAAGRACGSSLSMTNNTWHFVAGVADGANTYCVVNDTWSLPSSAYAGVIPTNNTALTIMADSDPANYQNADWGFLRIYAKVFTAAELLSIYRQERHLFGE